MLTWRMICHGRVQEVGFRFFTYVEARTLAVMGTVENLPDDTVEIYAQAEQEAILECFIKKLYQGNGFSHVNYIDKYIIDLEKKKKFIIK